MEQEQEQEQIETKILNKNLKWYAMNIASNQEKSIKKNILKEIGLTGLENYITNLEIPMKKELTFKNGKKVIKERITMPGYLLIEADLTNGEIIPMMKNMKGVFGFITSTRDKGADAKPAPLRNFEVDRLLERTGEITEEDLILRFVKGDVVRILEGPFATFEGEITTIDEQKKRVDVMVIIFGRETPLNLEFNQIDKL